MTAALTYGSGSSTSNTNGSTPSVGSTISKVVGGTGTLGASVSGTMSDEFTKDLKYSLDARSPQMIDGGAAFIVALRANEQKRIAGTYTYELMLDVPSYAAKFSDTKAGTTRVASVPVDDHVTADVRLIGVIRHVLKPGRTGTFKRVPEAQNDDTIEEYVVRDIPNVPLWTLSQPDGLDVETQKKDLVVFSNEDDTTFTVYSALGAKAEISRGSGREADLWLPDGKYDVVFDAINQSGGDTLIAPDKKAVTVSVGSSAPAVVVANYLPQVAKKAPSGGGKKGKAAAPGAGGHGGAAAGAGSHK